MGRESPAYGRAAKLDSTSSPRLCVTKPAIQSPGLRSDAVSNRVSGRPSSAATWIILTRCAVAAVGSRRSWSGRSRCRRDAPPDHLHPTPPAILAHLHGALTPGYQGFGALALLHGAGVAHMDIKPAKCAHDTCIPLTPTTPSAAATPPRSIMLKVSRGTEACRLTEKRKDETRDVEPLAAGDLKLALSQTRTNALRGYPCPQPGG